MASLAICALALANRLVCKPPSYFVHTLSIPFPEIFHKYLDSTFLQKYEEIFIIGDVHGCYDELKLLIDKANVTSDKILKIFVGDLVNKGPKNLEVLDFVQNSPSMLTVRGNHDEIIMKEFIKNTDDNNYKLKPKHAWVGDLKGADIMYLRDMPYTISLPSLNSVIVHAGLIPGKPLESNDPYDMVQMRNIVENDYFWDGGLQSSKFTKKGEPWASLWNGPQHVYFGHDAKRMLQKYPYATGLDTGCVYGNYLTGTFISGPRKGTYVNVKALEVYVPPKDMD